MRELGAVLVALSCLAAAGATPGLYLAPWSQKSYIQPQQDPFCAAFSACHNNVTCVCTQGQGKSCGTGTCTDCSSDAHCAEHLSCIQGKCEDPCLGRCGANTVCEVINHKPICACFQNHNGNPINGCLRDKPSVCDSNAVCPSDKICVGQFCVNPCSSINCPTATECLIFNHTVTCVNKPPVITDCTSNEHCAVQRTCINNHCVDLCASNICGDSAICYANDHRVTCVSKPKPRNECTSDEECPSDKRCDGKKCYDPCEGSVCPKTAVCNVVQHVVTCISYPVPGSCVSNENCASDKTCVLGKCVDPCENILCENDGLCRIIDHKVVCLKRGGKDQCKINKDCPTDKNCVNNQCVDPCDTKVCGDGDCKVKDHEVICNPKPTEEGNCRVNDDCKPEQNCLKGKCVDPCFKFKCGFNEVCVSENHKAVCQKKGECAENSDCPSDKICYDFKCVNLCLNPICGDNAICQITDHKITCISKPTSEEVCTENSQCKPDKNCVDNKCIDPCKTNVCGPNSVCEVVDHDIRCVRKKGSGDCESSSDCPSEKICSNNTCTDPCKTKVCGPNAICKVSNNTITCITKVPCKSNCKKDNDCDKNKACRCGDCIDPCLELGICDKEDTCVVTNHVATCVRKLDPELSNCTSNTDCTGTFVCRNKKCVDICATKTCGKNADCKVVNNAAQCVCQDGFYGNADNECQEEGAGGNKIGDCSGNLFEKPIAPKKYYAVTNIKTDWHSAFMYCHVHGRRLAIVENPEENEKILSEIRNTEIRNGEFWVGGTDNGFESKWKWMTTGLPITSFTYWHKYRPVCDIGRNCLEYAEFAGNQEGYKWYDGVCTLKCNFICEDFEL